MSLFEIFLVGVGLSMDAFAVSVTNGMCKRGGTLFIAASCGLAFGLFQGLMPSIGFALGSTFAKYITRFDHIIALVLLAYIGEKMIYDAIKGGETEATGALLKPGELVTQAVATSIDALAVGVSFASLMALPRMLVSAGIIALTTFVIAFLGVFIGKKFGDALSGKAQLVGGVILVAIGLKIFIEHTFFGQ